MISLYPEVISCKKSTLEIIGSVLLACKIKTIYLIYRVHDNKRYGESV